MKKISAREHRSVIDVPLPVRSNGPHFRLYACQGNPSSCTINTAPLNGWMTCIFNLSIHSDVNVHKISNKRILLYYGGSFITSLLRLISRVRYAAGFWLLQMITTDLNVICKYIHDLQMSPWHIHTLFPYLYCRYGSRKVTTLIVWYSVCRNTGVLVKWTKCVSWHHFDWSYMQSGFLFCSAEVRVQINSHGWRKSMQIALRRNEMETFTADEQLDVLAIFWIIYGMSLKLALPIVKCHWSKVQSQNKYGQYVFFTI